MSNPMKMMKQVQQMQAKMEKMQAELAQETVAFSAGGGMISATATCDGTLKAIKIDPKVVDPEDVEMLEDLVVVAVDGAIQAGRDKMGTEMAKVTEGLKLPGGMNLPF
jgi:DNA-binding YbaB/EbfC family protein